VKAVRADFARPRTISRWWWGAIAAGVSLAGVLAWDYASSARATAALRAEQVAREQSSKAASDVPTPAPPTAAPKPYDLSAREMLQQHETPWPRLLDAMEGGSIQGVRVVNIDYAASECQARVEVAVAQQSLALEYVAALNNGLPASGAAWRWSVLRIEQGRADAAARAVLLARWAMR
jgi:hypothetical protein